MVRVNGLAVRSRLPYLISSALIVFGVTLLALTYVASQQPCAGLCAHLVNPNPIGVILVSSGLITAVGTYLTRRGPWLRGALGISD